MDKKILKINLTRKIILFYQLGQVTKEKTDVVTILICRQLINKEQKLDEYNKFDDKVSYILHVHTRLIKLSMKYRSVV